MSTGASQLDEAERQELVDLGWEVDAAHQSVPIDHMPDVDQEDIQEGGRMAIKLSDCSYEEQWIAAEAKKPLLDVCR